MMIKKPLVILICIMMLTVVYFTGCKKNLAPATFEDTGATILFTGAVAADGCGYEVRINNVLYHADNLADTFSIDKLNVVISANLTNNKYQCGGSPGNLLPVIHLIAIAKQ